MKWEREARKDGCSKIPCAGGWRKQPTSTNWQNCKKSPGAAGGSRCWWLCIFPSWLGSCSHDSFSPQATWQVEELGLNQKRFESDKLGSCSKSYFKWYLPCNFRKPWINYPCQTKVNLWKWLSSSSLLIHLSGLSMSKGDRDVKHLGDLVPVYPAPWAHLSLTTPFLPVSFCLEEYTSS